MKNLTWVLSIAFAFVLLVPAVASAAPNTLTLTDKSGSAQTNYPLQFGRPFLQGEIRNYPQIKINGVAVQTQADIKNRYPDGSVKFAIISVMIPSIPANGSVTLSFQNQRSGNNPPLTAAQMLDAAYNFDAKMTLAFTSGQTRTVSARTMLQNGDHKPWTSGPIAQTIELADDTTARKYDQGNGDGYKPFRPRFYVTFWPVTRQVTVRYVGENGLTTELEDLTYNLTLTLGNTNPQNIYSADLTGTKKHWAMTNWTKTFWINGTPQKMVDINYNLAYLKDTRFFPNYDTNLTIDPAAVTSTYTSWTSRAKDLYDAGFWQKYMGTTGGRPDIAPYPRWSALWLYTGDWRLREISLSQADLAGAWTMNLRENNPTKILSRDDAPGSGTGLGRTVSVAGRPTFFSVRLTQTGTRVEDRVTIVGPLNVGSSWAWDGAHQPSPFYPQYILTGDPYYLALMYNWAGFSAASYNPGNSRGPSGAGGAIVDQLRGAGWVMRNRVETAFIAPDAHPEKHYFTYMTNDALARWEGGFNLTGTPFDGSAIKTWGTQGNSHSCNGGPHSCQPPPTHAWESQGNPTKDYQYILVEETKGVFQPGVVGSMTSTFMQYIVMYALGRANELGFASSRLQTYSGKWLVDMVNISGQPKLIATYRLPIEKKVTATSPGGYFTWNEIVTQAYTPTFMTKLSNFYTGPTIADSYGPLTRMAAAYLIDNSVPGATQAWSWLKTNVYDKVSDYSRNPQWSFVTRTDTNVLPAISTYMPPFPVK